MRKERAISLGSGSEHPFETSSVYLLYTTHKILYYLRSRANSSGGTGTESGFLGFLDKNSSQEMCASVCLIRLG